MTPKQAAEATEGSPQGSELSLTSAAEVEPLVRARGSLFVVTDRHGNITPKGARDLGLFLMDTRFLSHLTLSVPGANLVHLTSNRSHDAYNQIDLMMAGADGEFLDDPQNYFHLRRRQLLDDSFVEELTITSYLGRPTSLELVFEFDADFADIFEVRGAKRTSRGQRQPASLARDWVTLSYRGLDGARYATEIAFVPEPLELSESYARFRLEVAPGASERLYLHVHPRRAGVAETQGRHSFSGRSEQLMQRAEAFRSSCASMRCSNGVIQQTLDQSLADLGVLRLDVGGSPIIAAGIPWFCCPFGRDALIASYEALLINPTLAKDSLRVLAAYQGKRFNDENEEEPGKIFHELRFGEMAAAGETPHSPYFGSIDATPLFVIVADAVHQVTADQAWLEELRPAIEAALGWIDVHSESGTRFVSYARRSPRGLDNQGWKDSRAALAFPSGALAASPIALCEIQGYCVDAYARGARLFRTLGNAALADRYTERSQSLRELINERFWLADEKRYAYAIDGRERKLDTVVSNLGHLLWSRVPPPDRALATAELLLGSASFSGYGVRTLADGQAAFNPLSYHNGTVWPHDNALIAKGMANYRHTSHATALFEGLVEAMQYFRDRRLPELFCGLRREEGGLVRYPVACSPQAWAAAAPFLFFQSVLGLHPHAPERKLAIVNASLPPSVDWLEIDNLRIGEARVSVRFRRADKQVHIERLDITGAHLRTEIEHD
jgi:glycogen debranching enzyme